MELRIGIDVGGTFTDLFLQDATTGRFWIAKTPSTPADQSVGVVNGIDEICRTADIDRAELSAVLHGTTVATNAVLEGKGASVGLLVTGGWRNILHVGTSWTPGPLFGFFDYFDPPPLVPYERIREVPERMAADGSVITELDEDAAEAAVGELLDTGVEALTVCLLNSYVNSDHEERVVAIARRVCRERGLDVPVSASHEISPEFREYPRVVTTVMNSYLGPVMRRYLTGLEEKLDATGVTAPLQVVRSDGGLMSVTTAKEEPVQTALSGPSGGVNGAAFVSSRSGIDRIITFDMGGTSTDVAVCIGGEPTITRETSVGSFPVRAPSVDVATIGAGGGSIANVSEITGGLRVGPESAGADPGPACYGKGGVLPTVTDANVVLGHLPPVLLGGAMKLDVDAAHAAVQRIADQLEVDVHRAASAIIDIVNGNMLGALRVATVQKGLNPREHALVSFGGAGGLHANALAASLGCYPVMVPPEPGVLSALGFVTADVRNEFVRSFGSLLAVTDVEALRSRQATLSDEADRWLDHEGVRDEHRVVRHVLDMRYQRQGYEIAVEFDADEIASFDLDQIADRFHAEHERLYGFSLDDQPIELINTRSRAIGLTAKGGLDEQSPGDADPSSALVDTQTAWTDGELRDIPVYERSLLQPGMRLQGKAIVRQYDSTILVLPGHVARVDNWLNLLIDKDDA